MAETIKILGLPSPEFSGEAVIKMGKGAFFTIGLGKIDVFVYFDHVVENYRKAFITDRLAELLKRYDVKTVLAHGEEAVWKIIEEGEGNLIMFFAGQRLPVETGHGRNIIQFNLEEEDDILEKVFG